MQANLSQTISRDHETPLSLPLSTSLSLYVRCPLMIGLSTRQQLYADSQWPMARTHSLVYYTSLPNRGDIYICILYVCMHGIKRMGPSLAYKWRFKTLASSMAQYRPLYRSKQSVNAQDNAYYNATPHNDRQQD